MRQGKKEGEDQKAGIKEGKWMKKENRWEKEKDCPWEVRVGMKLAKIPDGYHTSHIPEKGGGRQMADGGGGGVGRMSFLLDPLFIPVSHCKSHVGGTPTNWPGVNRCLTDWLTA